MRKSKSDVLLEALSRNELKLFDKFLSYSLNGNAKDVLNYWNSKYSGNEDALKNRTDGSFSRKTLSDFNKQIEKFFIRINLEKDNASKMLFLSRELRRRNIYKYFERVLNYLKEAKKKTPGNNPRNRLNLLNLNFEKYLLYSSRDDYKNLYRIAKEESRITEVIISRSKLFEYFNEIYYGGKNSFSDTGLIKIKDVIANIEKNSENYKANYPNVWVLYLIYNITENFVDIDRIDSLYEYLKEKEKLISEEFLQFSYDSLFELLLRAIASGRNNTRENFYRIFLDIEKQGTLKRMIHIRPRYFPLFVAFVLESKDVSLAEKFVSEYKSKLVHTPNQEILNLCMARIEFSKGNYDKVIRLIKNMKMHDPVLYIQHKVIMLKTYYEKNEMRHIYPLNDSIKHYLKRKSLINQPANIILEFLACINKLVYAKKHKGKGLEYIESMLTDGKLFMQKKWIIEKYQQLKTTYDL